MRLGVPEKERALDSNYGVHRQYKGWGNWTGMAKVIQADHSCRTAPLDLVQAPGRRIGLAGHRERRYDSDLKALATMLKANDSQPVLAHLPP